MVTSQTTNMTHEIDIQREGTFPGFPDDEALLAWSAAGLAGLPDSEVCVRLVDAAEMQNLNATWRERDQPTNVLSFPGAGENPAGGPAHLGDVVICVPVVEREAGEQGKTLAAHVAHMLVHGMLHLQGHDHEVPDEAEVMESLERDVLQRLGFPDPYETHEVVT